VFPTRPTGIASSTGPFHSITDENIPGGSEMADKGHQEIGNREKKKKAKHSLKEKRKLRKERKGIQTITI
jgi:hypothetical protein